MLLLLLAGCNAPDSFRPISSQGASISHFFIGVMILAAVVYAIVMAVLAVAIIRAHRHPAIEVPARAIGKTRYQVLWTAGLIVMFGVLAVFMFRVMSTVADPAPEPLSVQVIGHDWWWEFRYPSLGIVTANEIYLPVDRPIRFEITGADVIHSFWVPRVGWKMDAIPGRTTTMDVRLDHTGVYDGGCTEYCGAEHAWMRIRLVAQSSDQFSAWIKQQQQPSVPPQNVVARQGLQVFLEHTCASCHSIAMGTGPSVKAQVGPDLTHFGSRATLGAGVVANTPANLERWIRDPNSIKPGVLMPAFPNLSKADIQALVQYLEDLK